MKLRNTNLLLATAFLMLSIAESRAEKSDYIPDFYGQMRARYEYLTTLDVGAFKVRTLRVGVEGNVVPNFMTYCAEMEFSDWGKFNLINGYFKFSPLKGLYAQIGQARMPFTISAHRQPWEQYFADRNFVAKYGGTRDIGLVGGYTFAKIPLTVQASFFNCSGTAEHHTYYTDKYGFTAKIISPFHRYWYASASTARITRGGARMQDYDVGAYFDNGLWHVEAEYMRRQYVGGGADPVNVVDFFVNRKFMIEKRVIDNVSGAARYDYMSDNCTGVTDDRGRLVVDVPERHRITVGATLTFRSKFSPYIRLNYEKYFLGEGVKQTTGASDRLVLEVAAHF